MIILKKIKTIILLTVFSLLIYFLPTWKNNFPYMIVRSNLISPMHFYPLVHNYEIKKESGKDILEITYYDHTEKYVMLEKYEFLILDRNTYTIQKIKGCEKGKDFKHKLFTTSVKNWF